MGLYPHSNHAQGIAGVYQHKMTSQFFVHFCFVGYCFCLTSFSVLIFFVIVLFFERLRKSMSVVRWRESGRSWKIGNNMIKIHCMKKIFATLFKEKVLTLSSTQSIFQIKSSVRELERCFSC